VLAWLLNIAHSRAVDRLRSRVSKQRSEVSLSFECSSATDPEADASDSEKKRHVRQALQALPFEQRRAIELAYFEKYSMTVNGSCDRNAPRQLAPCFTRKR
jgi:RNA polymerase sigma-70 factor, ECF subfamily